MRRLLTVCITLLAASGCIRTQVFLDPSLRAVSDRELSPKPAKPEPVQLVLQYNVNGVGDPKAERRTRPYIEDSLQKSGFFKIDSKAPSVLRVAVSETFNESDAIERTKFVVQTHGSYGTILTSDFLITGQLERAGVSVLKADYKTKLNVAVGDRELPKEVQPMSPREGNEEFCNRLTLGFIRDLVSSGAFSRK